MSKLFFALAGLSVGFACSKEASPAQNSASEIEILSPSSTLEYANTLELHFKIKDTDRLVRTFYRLSTLNGQSYRLNQIDIEPTTEYEFRDTLRVTQNFTDHLDNTGSNQLTVKAWDVFGNETVRNYSFEVIDTQKPQMRIFYFTPRAESGPNKTIEAHYELTDNVGLKSYKAELFELDANGELLQLLDSYQNEDLQGSIYEVESQYFVSTAAGYPAGINYQLLLSTTDNSGNTASHTSIVGTVQ